MTDWADYRQWATERLLEAKTWRKEVETYSPPVQTDQTKAALENLRRYGWLLERIALEHAQFVHNESGTEDVRL